MTLLGIAQIVIYFVVLLAITKPVGVFMYRLFEGHRTFLHPILRPLERMIYKLAGVREDEEHSWVRYSACLVSLSRAQRREKPRVSPRDPNRVFMV